MSVIQWFTIGIGFIYVYTSLTCTLHCTVTYSILQCIVILYRLKSFRSFQPSQWSRVLKKMDRLDVLTMMVPFFVTPSKFIGKLPFLDPDGGYYP